MLTGIPNLFLNLSRYWRQADWSVVSQIIFPLFKLSICMSVKTYLFIIGNICMSPFLQLLTCLPRFLNDSCFKITSASSFNILQCSPSCPTNLNSLKLVFPYLFTCLVIIFLLTHGGSYPLIEPSFAWTAVFFLHHPFPLHYLLQAPAYHYF